jgi:hypothetical protein
MIHRIGFSFRFLSSFCLFWSEIGGGIVEYLGQRKKMSRGEVEGGRGRK